MDTNTNTLTSSSPLRAIVMSAAANMPNSCWGVYRRVAVVLVDLSKLPEGAGRPRMISTHARGVVDVVETWERLNVGKTDRCAYARALAEAEALAAKINDGL